jgi:hypothetical protein
MHTEFQTLNMEVTIGLLSNDMYSGLRGCDTISKWKTFDTHTIISTATFFFEMT